MEEFNAFAENRTLKVTMGDFFPDVCLGFLLSMRKTFIFFGKLVRLKRWRNPLVFSLYVPACGSLIDQRFISNADLANVGRIHGRPSVDEQSFLSRWIVSDEQPGRRYSQRVNPQVKVFPSVFSPNAHNFAHHQWFISSEEGGKFNVRLWR